MGYSQEKLEQARRDKHEADLENELLNSQLDNAVKEGERLSNLNENQRIEIAETKSALMAADLTITELERQIAEANALAAQRREFAGNVRKANEAFALDNQRLRVRVKELERPIINVPKKD